jgi:hypothetical protein
MDLCKHHSEHQTTDKLFAQQIFEVTNIVHDNYSSGYQAATFWCERGQSHVAQIMRVFWLRLIPPAARSGTNVQYQASFKALGFRLIANNLPRLVSFTTARTNTENSCGLGLAACERKRSRRRGICEQRCRNYNDRVSRRDFTASRILTNFTWRLYCDAQRTT